ncbi:MAG TPA: POTRA domain-containing protein, partial [Rhodanobacteraceae bacterium]|nr:POTRA domain-containing protein [Rhodanobacteraceae bacterium]
MLLAATLSVQIDGVDDTLKPAVSAAAEIMQYDKREVSAAQARRLYDRAPEQIAKSLEAYGYYNATADGELKEAPAGLVAIVHVHTGEATTVATFKIDVPDPARDEKPVAKAIAEFTPRQGQRFDHGAYEKSKAAVQAALVATGYLDASLSTRRVEVSRGANRATIELQWSPGVRYRYGPTTFSGDQFTEGLLDRYVPWHEGDFYAQLQLLKLQQRLIDADYFAVAQVQPDIEHAHDAIVPIKVMLAPAKRTIYTGGLFIGTDTGFGVRGGVTRRWLNSRGHKGKVEAIIAERLKTVNATYQ